MMLKNRFYLVSTLFFLVIISFKVHGLEINSIVTKQCQKYSGVILFVNQSSIKIIDLEGNLQIVNIDEIDSIFTYGLKENPFSRFDFTSNNSSRYLKEVYFEYDRAKPNFIGVPIKFVEDLIFFYSLDAKIYILSFSQISKLRPHKKQQTINTLDFVPVHLEVSDYLEKCKFKQPSNKSVKILRPVRILSDQIKIDQFLGGFIKGQHNLNNFEERTYLYAKPFLFSKRAKLSVPYFQKNFGIVPTLPFAYIWSSGTEYHFQSNTGVGSQVSENLPYLGPNFLFRSDFKSHFFSGSFEGNVLGISAGTFPDTSFFQDNNRVVKANAVENFNYLAIMGADYGPFSIGFGPYFPVHQLTFGRLYSRAVLAYKVSPLFRFMYTKEKYKIRLTMSQTKYEYNESEINNRLRVMYNSEKLNEPFSRLPFTTEITPPFDDINKISNYQFVSRFVRIGGEINVNNQVKIFGDAVYTQGNYSEVYSRFRNELSYKNAIISIGVQHEFSHYVNLKFQYKRLIRKNTGIFNDLSVSNMNTLSTFGGHFELLF